MKLDIQISDDVATADVDAIHRMLIDYNTAQVGPSGYRKLSVIVRGSAGEICGGLNGVTTRGWLFVDTLVVRDDLRRHAFGSMLLAAAEREALARGCIGSYLDTTSFQARPFYLKQGYSEIGVLAEFPIGHTRHWLAKRFAGAAVDGYPITLPAGFEIEVCDEPSTADFDAVEQMLEDFNFAAVGGGDRSIFAVLREPNGVVAGGLEGVTFWGWLFVKNLVVRLDLRGNGHGTALLEAVEAESRLRGCRAVYLDTHSFQALPFYTKQGYSVFAEIADFPHGHSRYWVWKPL